MLAAAHRRCGGAVGTNAILKPFQKARLFVFLNPKARSAGRRLQSQPVEDRGRQRRVARARLAPRHADAAELRPRPLARFHLHGIGRRVRLLRRARAARALYVVAALRRRFARCSPRATGSAFCSPPGSSAMLFFHILVNIGMTIGIMPITGIPLPFMSFGGSAILTDSPRSACCSTSTRRKIATYSVTRSRSTLPARGGSLRENRLRRLGEQLDEVG